MVDHPAQRLLKFYKERGTLVKMTSKPWSRDQLSAALSQGVHRLCMEHTEFLHKEFHDTILKSQWVVLLAEDVAHLPGLRISSPGIVPQQDRHPRWICDYTWSEVNKDSLPLAPLEAMQFGHSLG